MAATELARDWVRLRRSLRVAEGFAPYFIFTDWPEQVAAGQAYLQESLRLHSRRLLPVCPDQAADLVARAVATLVGETHRQAVWLEAWRFGNDADWQQARRQLLARLNEGRGQLEKQFAAPVFLLLPLDMVSVAAEAAPDLWSIRRLTLHLARPAMAAMVAVAQPVAPERPQPREAVDPALAQRRLEAWQRQAGSEEANLWDAFDAVDALLESGQLAQARVVASEALTQARNRAGDAEGQRQLSVALDRFGDASSGLGDLEAARSAYRESLELCRQLRCALGDTPQALRDLSVSLDKVGDVSSALGELEAARTAYRESLELCRQLRGALGETPQVLRDLSISLDNVGDVSSALGELEAARSAYRESLELRRQLRCALGDTPQALRDLSISLNKVGGVSAALGELEAARSAYRESLDLSRQLRGALGDTPEVLRDLAVSLANLGRLAADAEDWPTARRLLEESLALFRQLFAYLGDLPQANADLGYALRLMARVALAQGETALAEALAAEAEALRHTPGQAEGVPASANLDSPAANPDNPGQA